MPSLKNINGILVRWVVSLDAAKSKQCLDASVSKIQNVLEHCFQTLFKLCFTNWSMSQQGHVPTTHQESPRRKFLAFRSLPRHELRRFKFVYTAQTLVFWVVHTRIIFIRLQIFPLWRPFTCTKVGKNARYNLKIVNFNGLDLGIRGELSHSRSRYQFCFQMITKVNNLLNSFSWLSRVQNRCI